MTRSINIIVNPASGQGEPVLNIFNTAFQPHDIDWDVSITRGKGDASRYAEALVGEVDVLGVYGGDGTIGEVADALIDSDTPLAVFAGGTGNAFARSLGTPLKLMDAARMVADTSLHTVTLIDTARVNDESCYTVAGATGIIAKTMRGASRQEKDDMGLLAYTIALLREMVQATTTTYTITVDGTAHEVEGVSVFVANAGNFGWQNITFFREMHVTDGQLDVHLIRNSDLISVLNAFLEASSLQVPSIKLPHWRGTEVRIEAAREELFLFDGEGQVSLPVEIRTQPESLPVVVPVLK